MSAATASLTPVRGVDPANMDRSVSPGDDFYLYSNGAWLASNPIPDEYSRWGAFEAVHELTQAQLRVILDECASVAGADGTELHQRLVGTYYASGMDEAAREKAGLRVLDDVYEEIEKAQSPAELVVTSAVLRKEMGIPAAGFWSLFESADRKNSGWSVLHVYQGGLGIGDRDFYLEEEESKKEIREKYVAHLVRLLKLMGSEEEEATSLADGIMKLETKMAEACMTKTEKRDPHATYNKFASPVALEEGTGSAGIPWEKFFAVYGLSGDDFGGIVLDNPKFFAKMSELLADESIPLGVWKAYVLVHATSAMSPYLSQALVEEHFEFYMKAMSGQPKMKPLWKRVSSQVGSAVEESLGILYVSKHFSPEAKKTCKEMVDLIARVVGDKFEGLEWMGPETKKRAHAKLDRFRAKIAYPDVWDIAHCEDLAKEVSADKPFGENIRAAARSDVRRVLARVNKPIDKERWFMPAFMVNACFVPTRNEILFPSAILQPPFFSGPSEAMPQGDVACNFGGIGAVIAHEITHGFDDQGRKYDEEGELNDWWQPEDAEEYTKRTDLLVEQFENYKVHDKPVNGKLCLGENAADLGGVCLAYAGMQEYIKQNGPLPDVDGFTPNQRFFLSWSAVWRNNIRKEMALQRLVMDPHSPGFVRANGPLSILSEFHEAFNVKEGDKMFVPPEKRCVLW